MAEYERSYKAPEFWMESLRKLVVKPGWTHVKLAARASEIAEREPPWDSTRVSRFMNGLAQTLEMTWAIAEAVGLPPPIVEARSMDESDALYRKAKEFTPVGSNPETVRKIAAIAKRVDSIDESATDQTGVVNSSDEGTIRRGRTRRSPARR